MPTGWSRVKLCIYPTEDNHPSFLSEPLKFRLNHLLRDDLSFPSELPFSPGLSDLPSSTETLLVLPLPKLLLLPWLLCVLTTVKAECILSRCFNSSSTCFKNGRKYKIAKHNLSDLTIANIRYSLQQIGLLLDS